MWDDGEEEEEEEEVVWMMMKVLMINLVCVFLGKEHCMCSHVYMNNKKKKEKRWETWKRLKRNKTKIGWDDKLYWLSFLLDWFDDLMFLRLLILIVNTTVYDKTSYSYILF